jgi:putative endonuclease
VTQARRALGASGEDLVAEWYEARGYRMLDRNWRCRTGELDIVAGRGGLVVFCEVKTRSSVAFGVPAEAVTRVKQMRLRRLGAQWLEQSGARAGELRFDVACVLADVVEVIEGAF